jgi:hypothetical protein
LIWYVLMALLAFLATGVVYWGVVFWPWIKHREIVRPLGSWRRIMLALPIIFICLMILRADASQLFGVVSPPLGLVVISKKLSKFSTFVWPLLLASTTVFVSVTIILFKFFPKIKTWHASIAMLAGITTFLAVGEIRARVLQMANIEKMNFDCVRFKSFTKSIAIAEEEFQFDYHTSGQIGKDVYGWSYKELNFYKVPASVSPNLDSPCSVK